MIPPNRNQDSFSNHPDNWRGADVVWDNVPDDDDDEEILELEPIDPYTTQARAQFHSADEIAVYADELKPEKAESEGSLVRIQFSVSKLLVATTIVAVLLALRQVLNSGLLAGFLGFVVFGTLLFGSLLQVDDPRVKKAWWCLVGLYLVTSFFAVIFG